MDADASHYLLADVPDVVPKEHHDALKSAGIVNTAQLYERTVTRGPRKALAAQTKIAVADLLAFARLLDLMQIEGIGPKMTRLLNAAGVSTLRQLQKADPVELHKKMRAVNRAGEYSEVVPTADVLKGWVDRALATKPRLQE